MNPAMNNQELAFLARVYPATIIGAESRDHQGRSTLFYHLRFDGCGPEDDTWCTAHQVELEYPTKFDAMVRHYESQQRNNKAPAAQGFMPISQPISQLEAGGMMGGFGNGMTQLMGAPTQLMDGGATQHVDNTSAFPSTLFPPTYPSHATAHPLSSIMPSMPPPRPRPIMSAAEVMAVAEAAAKRAALKAEQRQQQQKQEEEARRAAAAAAAAAAPVPAHAPAPLAPVNPPPAPVSNKKRPQPEVQVVEEQGQEEEEEEEAPLAKRTRGRANKENEKNEKKQVEDKERKQAEERERREMEKDAERERRRLEKKDKQKDKEMEEKENKTHGAHKALLPHANVVILTGEEADDDALMLHLAVNRNRAQPPARPAMMETHGAAAAAAAATFSSPPPPSAPVVIAGDEEWMTRLLRNPVRAAAMQIVKTFQSDVGVEFHLKWETDKRKDGEEEQGEKDEYKILATDLIARCRARPGVAETEVMAKVAELFLGKVTKGAPKKRGEEKKNGEK